MTHRRWPLARTLALVLGTAALVLLAVRLTGRSGTPVDAAAPGFAARPAVGAMAPAFELQDADNHPVRVGGPARRWTIINFYRRALSPW